MSYFSNDEKLNILERIWYKYSTYDYDNKVRKVLDDDEDYIFYDLREKLIVEKSINKDGLFFWELDNIYASIYISLKRRYDPKGVICLVEPFSSFNDKAFGYRRILTIILNKEGETIDLSGLRLFKMYVNPHNEFIFRYKNKNIGGYSCHPPSFKVILKVLQKNNIPLRRKRELYNAYRTKFSYDVKICCNKCGKCLSEKEIRVNFVSNGWICPNKHCRDKIQKKNAKELFKDAQYFFNKQTFQEITNIY